MAETTVPNDPWGVVRGDKKDVNPSATEVNNLHTNCDVDSTVNAFHHRLGNRRNQASQGDHTHNGENGVKLGKGDGNVLTGAKGGNVALTNLIALLAQYIEFTDNTT